MTLFIISIEPPTTTRLTLIVALAVSLRLRAVELVECACHRIAAASTILFQVVGVHLKRPYIPESVESVVPKPGPPAAFPS